MNTNEREGEGDELLGKRMMMPLHGAVTFVKLPIFPSWPNPLDFP
jgi:hypothetical protein